MVNGDLGNLGVSATQQQEPNQDQEIVTIQLLKMKVHHVLEIRNKQKSVRHDSKAQTRLTVGRVKPFNDFHRLCARDAIMTPYKVCSGRQFPVPESFFILDF